MKHLYIIVLACILGGTTSCSDYLEVDKYFNDMLNIDTVFVKKTYTEKWLWETYGTLKGRGMEISNKGDNAFNYASDDLIFGDWDGLCQRYQNCEYDSNNMLQEDRWGLLYKGIRLASIFIHNVDRCKELSSSEREDYRGQARFLRAYFYWMLMKQWGPVPLIPDEGQDISASYEELALPRASYDECVEFVTSELFQAARVLPEGRSSALFGQPTRGAALALRAKVLLYAASPLFNGNQDLFNLKDNTGRILINQEYSNEKWARAAAAAEEVINMGVYDLLTVPASETTVKLDPSENSAFANNWPDGCANIDPFESYRQGFNGEVTAGSNPEIIFGRITSRGTLEDIVKHCYPYSMGGWNTIAVSQKQVDAYYMCDGKDKGQASGKYPYRTDKFTQVQGEIPFLPISVNYMYAYREPRFYASIAYNGSIWESATTTKVEYKNKQIFFYKGQADGKTLAAPKWFLRTGTGMKKYYNPDDAWTEGGSRKQTRYEPNIRYADVLLWYAEAMNEVDGSYTFATFDNKEITITRDPKKIEDAFKLVRFRAGLPADNVNYNDRNEFRKALKRERQIEFFAESSRYFDLRRWKDAATEESQAIKGLNVDMNDGNEQKYRFYEIVLSDMPKVFLDKMYLWPVPQWELNRNGKLTQNPGW